LFAVDDVDVVAAGVASGALPVVSSEAPTEDKFEVDSVLDVVDDDGSELE
jgi:hypothetical protein